VESPGPDPELPNAEEERERVSRLEIERETAIVRERTRLAGEIHDTLSQCLAMIVMQLADAEAKLGPEWTRAEKPLSMVRELAVESLAYAGGRSTCCGRMLAMAGSRARFAMSPTVSPGTLKDRSISPSRRRCIARCRGRVGAHRHCTRGDHECGETRHATRIVTELDFARGGAARLVVSDDGIGFDPNAVRADSHGWPACRNAPLAATSH